MRPEDVLAQAIGRAAQGVVRRALKVGVATLPATFVGTDAEGKGWVLLPGAESPTPVRRLSVDAAKGDTVSATVGNGMVVVDGNISNPSAGMVRVSDVGERADAAGDAAKKAYAHADSAHSAARAAQDQADNALRSATEAQGSADAAAASAARATEHADEAQGQAVRATESADEAERMAVDAVDSAASARSAARTAVTQLSDVEKVVGTVTWIAEHGTYDTAAGTEFDEYTVYYSRSNEVWELTGDEAVDPNKTYYSRTGSGTEEDPYVYSVVLQPVDSELSSYYELVSALFTEVAEPVAEDVDTYYTLAVEDSVQNYIASHLALTNDGLYLMADWSLYKMLVAPDGVHVIDAVNMERAMYGIETRIGPLSDFHITINGNRLEFYQGETSASYVSNNQMMMPAGIIRDTLQVGDWAFVAQESGNLSLTWIGDDA